MSKRKDSQVGEKQVNHWLAWLAKNMQRHDQTVFLIENLQPSWLQTRGELRLFVYATRVLWGIWVGLIFGLIGGLMDMLVDGLMVGLICGLISGLIFGRIDTRKLGKERSADMILVDPTLRQFVIGVLRMTLIFGLIFGLVFGLPLFVDSLSDRLIDMLSFGLLLGLFFGLLFGLVYMSRSTYRTPSTAILPVEALSWSRTAAIRSGSQGLISGFIVGLIFGLVFGLPLGLFEGPSDVFIGGLIIGPIGGLIGGLVGGFKPAIRDLKTEPDQGIWLSLRNATRIGGPGGLVIGLGVGFVSTLFGKGTEASLGLGLAYGLLSAMILGVWFGGFDATAHGILRLILWRKGYAPRNYAEFLDYAADELNFLQKVGGGYIFIHRYLLEYFASIADEPVAPTEEVTQTVAAGDD